MAKKNRGFGGMLLFGAAAAALGGVAAYLSRQSIEKTVKDIADRLEAREEDGFYSVDLDDDRVIHAVFPREAAEDDMSDSDFVDVPGQARQEEEGFVADPAPEEPESDPVPPEE